MTHAPPSMCAAACDGVQTNGGAEELPATRPCPPPQVSCTARSRSSRSIEYFVQGGINRRLSLPLLHLRPLCTLHHASARLLVVGRPNAMFPSVVVCIRDTASWHCCCTRESDDAVGQPHSHASPRLATLVTGPTARGRWCQLVAVACRARCVPGWAASTLVLRDTVRPDRLMFLHHGRRATY